MNIDLIKSKEILQSGNFTCVLVKNNMIYKSTDRGVIPLLNLIETKVDFRGYSASDRVIGKAVAFLYTLLGVKEIYTFVISKSALDVLNKYNIVVYYDKLVEYIINRNCTGICPMEQATKDIKEPYNALSVIKETLKKLQNQ